MKQCNDTQTLFNKNHDYLMDLSEELDTCHKDNYIQLV